MTRVPSPFRMFAALALASLAACGDSSTEPEGGPDIRDYISSVGAVQGSAAAQYRAGTPPTGTGSGPSADVSGSSAIILGGSALRTVSSSATMTKIVVSIDGVEGYWELPLAGTTSQDIILTMAQEPPTGTFTMDFAAGSTAGLGTPASEPVSIVTVGTGDVQVSVSWDAMSDVDLHVVDPSGAEVYYGSDLVASGGRLDLDSNASCGIDGKNNENITWPTGSAPRGSYTVRVDYWDSCGVAKTNYVVTVRVKGKAPAVYSGSFTGAGDMGGSGSGVQIATFTY